VTEGNALDPLFDDAGYSRVAGTAALLPTGPTTPEVVRELAAAGVRAVLVDGPIPAGSLGVDEPVEVPIVGIPAATAAEVRATLAAGLPIELAVGAPAFGANPELGAVAPFSSTGLALDGGARPELAAPGVGLVTSVPGRGEEARRATGRSAVRARCGGRRGRRGTAADARPISTPAPRRARRQRTAGSERRGSRVRRPRGGVGRRARGRPTGRCARRPRRARDARDRDGDAPERLAEAARRPPAAGCRDDRGHRHDQP
jgi:hypothetical protein